MPEPSLTLLMELMQRNNSELAAVRGEMGDVRAEVAAIRLEAKDARAEVRAMRAEYRENRALLVGISEQGRRQERRIDALGQRVGDLVPELELMLRSEMMGRLSYFENQFEARFDRIEQRFPEAAP